MAGERQNTQPPQKLPERKKRTLSRGLRHRACTLEKCAAGAGPLPVPRSCDEAGAHGIPFDVMTDALEFGGVPYPRIKRLILPEGLSCTAHSGVSTARRRSE